MRHHQRGPTGGGGALQVIADDAVHALHLLMQGALASAVGIDLTQLRAHHRKRSLQAVREIRQRIAIALLPCTLVREQRSDCP